MTSTSIHFTHCPICLSDNIAESISAVDYTVTQQEFWIWKCSNCTASFTQNIPTQELIGKYYASEQYVSHSDTKEGLMNRLYHRVRRRTLNSKRNLIKESTGLHTGAILDIGCGTGAFLAGMRDAGWKVTGIEPDPTARENAALLNHIEPLTSESLHKLDSKQFDVITMWHVLEHVHDLHGYLDQIVRLLKPGGQVFIAVPNYTSLDAQHYGKYWAAYDVPRHLYHFSPSSMRKLLENHSLRLGVSKPMWYDAFYVSMLSETYRKPGGSLVFAFWNAFRSNMNALKNHTRCSSLIYIAHNQKS